MAVVVSSVSTDSVSAAPVSAAAASFDVELREDRLERLVGILRKCSEVGTVDEARAVKTVDKLAAVSCPGVSLLSKVLISCNRRWTSLCRR